MITRVNSRQIATIIGLGAICAVLSACGSSTQEASEPTPQASTSSQRAAGLYRSSQVCVVNNSPNIISVAFTKKDASQGEGVLQPNAGVPGQACGNGSFTFSDDLEGNITTTSPDSALQFSTLNQSFMKPSFFGWAQVADEQFNCLLVRKADVGKSATWDNGILKFTTTREDDTSDYIRWRVDVAGTENPTPVGKPRTKCSN